MESVNTDPIPRTERIATSFTARTPEVEMVLRVMEGSKLPTVIYEILQGCLDYNDWKQGPPSVWVEDDGGRRSLWEYLENGRKGEVKAIEMRNFIGERGLNPFDVTQIEHKGGSGTLGEHGRGTSVGIVAVLAGGHASRVVMSSVHEGTVWRGEAKMAENRLKGGLTGSEGLVLDVEMGGENDGETIVRLEEPSELLLTCLAKLETYFLPADRHYQHFRFAEVGGGQRNVLEVGLARGGVRFDPDARAMLVDGKLPEHPTEQYRVEILPQRYWPVDGRPTRRTYVGGVNLQSHREYAVTWSFYVPADVMAHRANPRRSSSSIYMEGDAGRLVGLALEKCHSQEVFRQILEVSHRGVECVEGVLEGFELRRMQGGARKALVAAFEEMVQEELGTGSEGVVVTSSRNLAEMARALGRRVMYFKSEELAELVAECAKVKMAEEVIGVESAARETDETLSIVRTDNSLHEAQFVETTIDMLAKRGGKVSRREGGGLVIVAPEGIASPFRGEVTDLGFDVVWMVQNLLAAHYDEVVVEIYAVGEQERRLFQFDRRKRSEERYKFDIKSAVLVGDDRERGLRIEIRPKYPEKQEIWEGLETKVVEEFELIAGADGRGDYERQLARGRAETAALREVLARRKQELIVIEGVVGEVVGGKRRYNGGEDERGTGSGRLVARLAGRMPGVPDETGFEVGTPGYKSVGESAAMTILQIVKPDANFYPERVMISGHMVTNLESGDTGGPNYVPVEVKREKMKGPRWVYRLPFKTQRAAVPLPVGDYEVAGYYHPGGAEVKFSRDSGSGNWRMELPPDTEAGLTIYYQKSVAEQQVSSRDREEVVRLEDLSIEWRRLVETLRDDVELSEKRKLDILITAWKRAFTYTSSLEVNDLYEGLDESQKLAKIVNNAIGNCGHCGEGLRALCRAAGLAAKRAEGYSVTMGRVDLNENIHKFDKVFVDGRWVWVEPQLGYIDKGMKIGDIPEGYRELIAGIEPAMFDVRQAWSDVGEIAAYAGVVVVPVGGVVVGASALGLMALHGVVGGSVAPIMSQAPTVAKEIVEVGGWIAQGFPWVAITAGLLGSAKMGMMWGERRMAKEIAGRVKEALAKMGG